jgi:hypothetical protein
MLSPKHKAIAQAPGNGNVSHGVRSALATAKENGLVCRVESGRIDCGADGRADAGVNIGHTGDAVPSDDRQKRQIF